MPTENVKLFPDKVKVEGAISEYLHVVVAIPVWSDYSQRACHCNLVANGAMKSVFLW